MRLLKYMRLWFLTDLINKESEKSILIHAHAPNRKPTNNGLFLLQKTMLQHLNCLLSSVVFSY